MRGCSSDRGRYSNLLARSWEVPHSNEPEMKEKAGRLCSRHLRLVATGGVNTRSTLQEERVYCVFGG